MWMMVWVDAGPNEGFWGVSWCVNACWRILKEKEREHVHLYSFILFPVAADSFETA